MCVRSMDICNDIRQWTYVKLLFSNKQTDEFSGHIDSILREVNTNEIPDQALINMTY